MLLRESVKDNEVYIMDSLEAPGKAQLPVVDFSKIRSHRSEVAKTVLDGLQNTGFLFIDNVNGINFDKLHSGCQWFFGQPYDKKKRVMKNMWNPQNSNMYRGYFPIIDKNPSRKEGFEFGRDVDSSMVRGNWFYEESPWPEEDGSFPFKEFLIETYEILHKTSMEILRLTAIGLGINENAFEPIFSDKPCSTFRIIHYPSWNGAPPVNAIVEDGKVVTTPIHTDTCFLTLLTTFHYRGLEVLNPDGEWIEIEPRPNSLVMNIGDTFSRMMGDRVKATQHRVLDIGKDRYSVPFFLEPAFDGDIGLNFMSQFEEGGGKHVVEKYGPWVLHKMKYEKKFSEYLKLPDIQ